MGLEAAYLAHGQSERVEECAAELKSFENLELVDFDENSAVDIGAFIRLDDESERSLSLFLGPASGGLKVVTDGEEITVITSSAPLGQQLLGKYLDDEFELTLGAEKKTYIVTFLA